MRINDALLNALADRWPNIEPQWPGQTFEVWLEGKMRYYNEFGYPKPLDELPIWFDDLPASLWDIVRDVEPADTDAYLYAKGEEIRQIGGTMVQRVRDLRPLARVAMALGL